MDAFSLLKLWIYTSFFLQISTMISLAFTLLIGLIAHGIEGWYYPGSYGFQSGGWHQPYGGYMPMPYHHHHHQPYPHYPPAAATSHSYQSYQTNTYHHHDIYHM